ETTHGEHGIRNPGDALEARVGADGADGGGEVGREAPLVRGHEFGAGAAHVEAQDRGAACAGCGVVAFGRHVDPAGGSTVGDGDAFGVGGAGAVGVAQLLALAPSVRAVPGSAYARC